MLWVLKRIISIKKHKFKMTHKKIFTILRSKILFIYKPIEPFLFFSRNTGSYLILHLKFCIYIPCGSFFWCSVYIQHLCPKLRHPFRVHSNYSTCTPQGTKIFQYYTCPAGRVSLTIFTRPANTCTCPFKAYAINNIREYFVIWLPWVILPKSTCPVGRVLCEELFVLSRFHS